MQESQGVSTASVHSGEPRRRPSLSVTEPIVNGVMFPFAHTQEMIDFLDERKFAGQADRFDYGRYGNPTLRAAETKLAALEAHGRDDAEPLDALLTSSGMSALAGLLLYLLSAGDHLIIADSIYRVSKQFAADTLTRFGVEVTTLPACRLADVQDAWRNNTKAVVVESPSNPFNRCIDLQGLAAWGRARGVKTVVDSTLATPFNCRPLAHGIDYVIHSVTKYLSGHNDVIAGVIIAEEWSLAGLRSIQTQLGAVLDSQSCYAILRGLKTFGLRMRQHNANALALARMLAAQDPVLNVWYAGLENHPDHAVACRQMSGFGGVVSFEVENHERAARLNDRLTLALLGASLGATETLVHQPWLLSHYEEPRAQREAQGIRDGLIRVACGIEDTADLLADFRRALDQT